MKQSLAASFCKLLFGGIIFGFLSGCSVFDPSEEIPSYLRITSISLNATGNQGSSTSDITDAWIFMDGKLLGAFELPCNVPILAEGTHVFVIRGGVKMNGLSSTRAIYPSWKGWEGSLILTRGQQTIISPSVTYFSGIDFANTWMLDFDLQGTSLVPEASSSGTVVLDTIPNSFEGPYSGLIKLNNTDTTFFIGANSVGYLMPPTIDTWIEFNYKSNCAFTVGIEETLNTSHRIPWLEVEPNSNWRKIYVRLTDALTQAANDGVNPSGTPYKIYIAAQNPSTQSQSYIYLDNIKLLK